VTRSLLVQCSAPRCQTTATVELRSTCLLPPGWRLMSNDYEKGSGIEFCSLTCVSAWSLAMDTAHRKQRAWQNKPLPVKPIDAKVPEGAML